MPVPPGRPLERVTAIVIHHSATEDSQTLSWGAIADYHTRVNGWNAIGYHAGAEYLRDGYQVLLGRADDRTGAHVAGTDPADGIRWNHKTLGFCFVGNYDRTAPPDALLEAAARRWIVPQIRRHGLTVQDLIPHNQLASYKSCPGSAFDMARLRAICTQVLEGYDRG